ncbi:unnamed protein product, partial [marine sediment metagenome]
GDAFDDKLRAAVLSGCLIVQNDAKEKCAYLTGNLRSSIHSKVAKEKKGYVEAEVGTNVVYAKRIEYGFNQADKLGRVYHQKAQPYLRPALDKNKKKVVAEIGSALKEVLR